MKMIIFFMVVAGASAAQLPSSNYLPPQGGSERNYLPPQGGSESNFHQSQSFHTSESASFGAGGADTGNRRPQQEVEKNAITLKQEQEVQENGNFHYSYETSNGIKAEEAGNNVQGGSHGSFSYNGDDGHTYTVTFTAGEDGFRPQGAHLPVPPPIPQEILLALEQNAKDEAAGIFDDGQYHPDAHGGASAQGHKGSGLFTPLSGPFSASSAAFGSTNHQGTFNSNSGYKY